MPSRGVTSGPLSSEPMKSFCSKWSVVVLTLVAAGRASGADPAAAKRDAIREIEAEIRHAETYYALGVAEQDNRLAYEAALKRLSEELSQARSQPVLL